MVAETVLILLAMSKYSSADKNYGVLIHCFTILCQLCDIFHISRLSVAHSNLLVPTSSIAW